MLRFLSLILGPPLIVGLAYLVARPDVPRPSTGPASMNFGEEPNQPVPGLSDVPCRQVR